MSKPRYRTWRFVNPEFDDSRQPAGINLSNRGGIQMVEGTGSVRQSILMLLSTRPGERVMRPNYGCHLHRLIFSPNDDTTAGLAMHYVRQAMERWEPRAEILDLEANRSDAEPNLLEIVLQYRVRATLQTESLTYSFDLTGERS